MKLIVQPADGTAPLLKGIAQAKKSIQIVIFRFDQADIEHALEEAAERGVFVHALIAFTNRGGEKNLRRLEMRFLEKGITVARTANDLARYHGKMMLVDGKELYLLTYNFTHLDTARSRSFGIVTRNRELIQAASQLFGCDTKRQAYVSRCNKLVVSPVNARKCLAAFLKGAKQELLIYDINLADKEMVRILEDRCRAGVQIKIIGHVAGSRYLTAHLLQKMRLHTRAIIRDSAQAFLGSQSLRKMELDARREIGIMVNNRKIVSKLATIFEGDWKTAVSDIPRSERKQLIDGHADRAARKVVKTVEKKLAPAPVIKQVLEIIQNEANVKVDSSQATQVVKGTLKKAVKKATAKIVEEALA
ncbi:MAG TPA: phospholipase D-like domain-containing protein [Candidatus Angelobacter sp.]|nr:phospholipase D-like domain-containing protein [Candidatus Angelobacter sp.]